MESGLKPFAVSHLSQSNGFSFSHTFLTDLGEKLKGTPSLQELNGLGKGPVRKFHNTNLSPERAAYPLGLEQRSFHPHLVIIRQRKSLAKANAEFTKCYPEPLPSFPGSCSENENSVLPPAICWFALPSPLSCNGAALKSKSEGNRKWFHNLNKWLSVCKDKSFPEITVEPMQG